MFCVNFPDLLNAIGVHVDFVNHIYSTVIFLHHIVLLEWQDTVCHACDIVNACAELVALNLRLQCRRSSSKHASLECDEVAIVMGSMRVRW